MFGGSPYTTCISVVLLVGVCLKLYHSARFSACLAHCPLWAMGAYVNRTDSLARFCALLPLPVLFPPSGAEKMTFSLLVRVSVLCVLSVAAPSLGGELSTANRYSGLRVGSAVLFSLSFWFGLLLYGLRALCAAALLCYEYPFAVSSYRAKPFQILVRTYLKVCTCTSVSLRYDF